MKNYNNMYKIYEYDTLKVLGEAKTEKEAFKLAMELKQAHFQETKNYTTTVIGFPLTFISNKTPKELLNK